MQIAVFQQNDEVTLPADRNFRYHLIICIAQLYGCLIIGSGVRKLVLEQYRKLCSAL